MGASSQGMPPAAIQQLAQKQQLPQGVDPRAVAADPQGYQRWMAGAKAQEASNPGSTMLSQQGQQNPQALAQGLQQQQAIQQAVGNMGKGGQPPAPAMGQLQGAAQQGLAGLAQRPAQVGNAPQANQPPMSMQRGGGMTGRPQMPRRGFGRF